MNRLVQRKRISLLCLAISCLACLSLSAQTGQAPAKKLITIEGITEYRLDNGVRFLLFPDPSSSTVTVNMTVLVGSRHEGYGETGMAHLLEHMLFKGSKEFPNVDKALQDHGAAEANGTTWVDRTNYYETMPGTPRNLEFGIRLEADRLVNCFIKREDLVSEMTVVRNEFEIGENDPRGILGQRMLAVAFEWHNYGKSTIGNRADIERVPIDRLQAFYRKYYQPDNIVLAVAGRFDEARAIELITKQFGAIPRPKRVLDKTYTEEPPQDGERVVTLRRVGKVAVVGVLYHIPASTHEDFPAAEMLEDLLTRAPSGRLYKALVETKKATAVSGVAWAWHDPSIMHITAEVSDGVRPEEVRDRMVAEVEGLVKKPATDAEVARSKQRFKAAFNRALRSSKRIAVELSEWAGAGDWRLMFLHRDRVAKVTPAEVNRVAGKYLVTNNRTVGMFLPTTQVARAQIPTAPTAALLVKDYKGGPPLAKGEPFDPTPANLEQRTKRTLLANGVKVGLLSKKTRGEMVVGRLTLHFGNEKSLAPHVTAADFLGQLMIRGTKKLSREEIQERLDELEATMSLGSSAGALSVSFQAKRQSAAELLDLLKDVLREPSLPEKEFEILRRQQLQGLQEMMVDPEALAFRALMRKLHPYAKDNIRYRPTFEEAAERVAKVTRDEVAKLYAEQVGAGHVEAALVGDFDSALVLKKLEGIFADWKSSVPYARIHHAADPTIRADRETIEVPDKESATYAAGFTMSLKDSHPDYVALSLGNYLLGGSSTSRLWDKLRQKDGLSYLVGSTFSASPRDPYSLFYVYAECNPLVIDKADKAAADELKQAIAKGFSGEEVSEAIKGYLQEMKVQFANDANVATALRQGLELGRTFDYHADLERQIAALTPADISRGLKHLSVERLVIVRAGDFSKKK